MSIRALPESQGYTFGERDIEDLINILEDESAPDMELECVEAIDDDIDYEDAGAKTKQKPIRIIPNAGGLDVKGHRSLWGTESAVPRPPKVWTMLASRACRGADMIGKVLQPPRMRTIIYRLSGMIQPFNCPHGRPTLRHIVSPASHCTRQKKVMNGKGKASEVTGGCKKK